MVTMAPAPGRREPLLFLIIAALPAIVDAQDTYSPYVGQSYPTNVYWGDTHLHTKLSHDAYSFGNRISPDDAYRFAKGKR